MLDVEARWYRSHLPDELDLPTGLDMEQQFWLPSRAANTDWALRLLRRHRRQHPFAVHER